MSIAALIRPSFEYIRLTSFNGELIPHEREKKEKRVGEIEKLFFLSPLLIAKDFFAAFVVIARSSSAFVDLRTAKVHSSFVLRQTALSESRLAFFFPSLISRKNFFLAIFESR